MISVGGNTYSVLDTTRRRVLAVHSMVDEICILEAGVLIASHAPLQDAGQVCIDPSHRHPRQRDDNAPGQRPVVLGTPAMWSRAARSISTMRWARGKVLAAKGNA